MMFDSFRTRQTPFVPMRHETQRKTLVRVKRQFVLLMRVMWDFVQGMYAFHLIGPCVTVFGSARLRENSPAYQQARELGMALGRAGITARTGGGPGLMEAANRGAREVGGQCVGCRMNLSIEQPVNHHVDRSVTFRYFFVRKVMLLRHSCALVVLPGGLGTLDELFEVLTLIQTRKMEPIPIVFLGSEYWTPVVEVVERMVMAGTLGAVGMKRVESMLLLTVDVYDVAAHVKANSPELAKRELKESIQAA